MRIKTHLLAGMTTQTISVDGIPLRVEVPSTTREQAQGLMCRPSLPNDQGMLFAFQQPQRLSFWMKDTTIPLEIGFFSSDGVLREIRTLTPLSHEPILSQRADIQYALEVNRGWFAQHNLAVQSAVLQLSSH